MKNFIQCGDTFAVTAPADVKSGDLVLVGAAFGVACTDAASGSSVEITAEGVFSLPKVTTDVLSVGDKAYFAVASKLITSTATDNTLVGVALSAAGNPSATVNVRLNDCFGV